MKYKSNLKYLKILNNYFKNFINIYIYNILKYLFSILKNFF